MLPDGGPVHLGAGENGGDDEIFKEVIDGNPEDLPEFIDLERDLTPEFFMEDVDGVVILELEQIL